MTGQLECPQWVTHFNQFGPDAGSEDRLIPLDAEELKHTACEICGLDDFGELASSQLATLKGL